MTKLSRYFINGLIVMIPIAITALFVLQLLQFTEGLLGRHLPSAVQFPGSGLLTMLLLILAVGWLSSTWVLKKLLALGERILGSIPILKFIYNSVKQLSTAVFESSHLFSNAVLVPFPHQDSRVLGFVTGELSKPLREHLAEESVCVFVPMSLNMTAGFNIMVPKKDIIPIDITSESALQYVLTAGAVMPHGDDTAKSLGRDDLSNRRWVTW